MKKLYVIAREVFSARLLCFVGFAFLIIMVSEACQPGTDRRRYCTFTPEAQIIGYRWLQ